MVYYERWVAIHQGGTMIIGKMSIALGFLYWLTMCQRPWLFWSAGPRLGGYLTRVEEGAGLGFGLQEMYGGSMHMCKVSRRAPMHSS